MNKNPLSLVCMQPCVKAEDYLTEAAFKSVLNRLGEQMEEKLADFPAGDRLVVFPEYFPSFLALCDEEALSGFDLSDATVDKAIERLVMRKPFKLLKAMIDGQTMETNPSVFRMLTPKVHRLIVSHFSSFASRHKATVVAGSALLCPITPDSIHLPEPEIVSSEFYNTSYVFGPHGQMLGVFRKINKVPTQEDVMGMSAALPGDQKPLDTPFGKLGVAICYDGFKMAHSQHEPGFTCLAEEFDREGVDIIAWPSANPWPWKDAWVFGEEPKTKLRETQWTEEGLEGYLGELHQVKLVLNPHLVGQVMDATFDGVSKILLRDKKKVKVLAAAKNHFEEDVIVAQVGGNRLET